ncbi:MAG: hypothetical protein A2W86_04595 [Bacteroidetes bacterium GWD2_45_23]|nr:carboxypeptidase-like regulatory domain-containing protein [Candidatus Cloacimonadota bacterium]MDD2261517.1 carboxypeptidase-like regulatory domain-containing protein [Clostridia bacterium]OFX53352.1 MAG: hypothetical protein A2W87_13440 [Bacteroidetes bacterium GWC2_46_850]OFX86358.1 MAG: hypothetical protein A2W86_04595 [Bacteroidetes bacterium GWD2_45_23]HAR39740.1 hypothetical protein [Porphyromonadaceae bacterium]
MKNLRKLFYTSLIVFVSIGLLSCEKEESSQSLLGEVAGMVKDVDGNPIPGVSVTLSGINEEDMVVTTGEDGRYHINNVTLKTHAIMFSKEGWQTVSVTVTADKFGGNSSANADIEMIKASAKIIGVVTDAKNNGAPLAGVTVSAGPAGTVITGTDGRYIIANLVEDKYTLTFTKQDYVTIVKEITATDFVDETVTIDLRMGGEELLRGLTADDLQHAEKWYYNEYRGGRNADEYPHWDWACNYMSTLDFRGAWEEQNEGTTLQIRNNDNDRKNPADLDVFDSFVFGSKLITAENKILSLRARTHNADVSAPAYFGVQVVDLSENQPKSVKIGTTRTYGSGNYADFEFDLSAYVGKEVILAIGIYRQSTGDYWKQLVLRAIRFADRKVENYGWLPGTEVIDGWKLTKETVRSTMPHTKKSFTGISPVTGDRGNYVNAYRAWRTVGHVGAEWSFVPLKKDPEVFPSEGYILKTRNTPDVDTKVPEAYIYAKFSIATGSNQFTLNTRNFGSNFTYFKITAIGNDGTVTHLSPASNTAQEAMAAANGTWKFKHGNGGADNPEGYASFKYDLTQFNGTDVTLSIGVYNGEANTGENKLVIHSIELK